MESHEHPLGWEAISRVILAGVALLFVWKASGAVIMLVVALVLSASLRPVVQALHKKTKLPLFPSALLVVFALLIPFIVLGLIVLPDLNTQLPQLLQNIDSTVRTLPFVGSSFSNFSIVHYMESISQNIIASSSTILYSIYSITTTLILTFYFVYDYDRLQKLFLDIFPYKEKAKLKGVIEEVARVSGQYIRGNIIISFLTFVVIYIGLLLLHIPFALPLALIAGIFDLLPLVGSSIGAIPAVFVAFSLSPFQGFAVIILHIVYQQTENALIGPAIYNKSLNLYPALVFLSVIIGASLFGILGAFLALPIAASIPAIVDYHENYKQRHESKNL